MEKSDENKPGCEVVRIPKFPFELLTDHLIYSFTLNCADQHGILGIGIEARECKYAQTQELSTSADLIPLQVI